MKLLNRVYKWSCHRTPTSWVLDLDPLVSIINFFVPTFFLLHCHISTGIDHQLSSYLYRTSYQRENRILLKISTYKTLAQDYSLKLYSIYILLLDLIVVDVHQGCSSKAKRQSKCSLLRDRIYQPSQSLNLLCKDEI